ncbi:MAG: M48 family metalloprotease, partial [bacterium]|nr:M48 family metalloprotease [bacterium]
GKASEISFQRGAPGKFAADGPDAKFKADSKVRPAGRAAKKDYGTRINVQIITAIVLFAVEIFAFDLKSLVLQLSVPVLYEFSGSVVGLAVFMLHLSIVWYWGFRSMGDILELGDSPKNYVRSNIKFNLVILIPWLIFSFVYDVAGRFFPGVEEIIATPLFREIFFAVFLVTIAIFTPLLIVRLWECKPMPPSPLKDKILAFCNSQGVKFKGVMTWNALGKSLVTAGVMGVAAPFRYLMITPALMDILDEDETMAVVSHEVGHVKKKHLIFYLVFFMGFIIVSGNIQDWILDFFLTTSFGLEMIFTPDGNVNVELIGLVSIPILLLFFVGYFRYVFGYFMRNFERQADGFCFNSGIDPNHLISSFMKLGVRVGDDGKKPNWHHYNLSQRIDFIRKGMDDRKVIARHDRKVKRGVVVFAAGLILFTVFSFNAYRGQSHLQRMAAVIEHQLDKTPENAQLYPFLGMVYYQLKEWKKCKKALEYAIGLEYRQPDALNNLAWLLLTSEDESLKNPKRALKLAKDAVALNETVHNVDTLAEAYYQNQMYWEAYKAAKRALQLADDDRSYYKNQLEKMKKEMAEKQGSGNRD